MEAQVVHAMTPPDASIPLEKMWARVAQAPRLVDAAALNRGALSTESSPAASGSVAGSVAGAVTSSSPSRRWVAPSLIAAGVVMGVAIGRFAWPAREPAPTVAPVAVRGVPAGDTLRTPQVTDTMRVSSATAPTAAVPTAVAPTIASTSATRSGAPARARRSLPITPVVAEHLQHTVAVLAAVRDGDHAAEADSATRRQLQQLLTTTRQLLDEPGARGSRTHRLLEDLELVLAQLARASTAAPATRAAADETLRETNLLPRLRAAAEARSGGGA
jgi:hypothetical protein